MKRNRARAQPSQISTHEADRMKLTEVDFGTMVPIDGYGPGFFRVSGEVIEGHLMMTPRSYGAWDGSWDAIIAAKGDFDVLFLGRGGDISALPDADADTLAGADISYEIMASPAACRTYNVLLSEGRRVACVMLTV